MFVLVAAVVSAVFGGCCCDAPITAVLSRLTGIIFCFMVFTVVATFTLFPLLGGPAPDFLGCLVFVPVTVLLFVDVCDFFRGIVGLVGCVSCSFNFEALFFCFLGTFFTILNAVMELVNLSTMFLGVSRFSFGGGVTWIGRTFVYFLGSGIVLEGSVSRRSVVLISVPSWMSSRRGSR